MFKRLYHIALRECGIMWKNPIYLFCMVIFPIVVVIFFTTLMQGGVPTDMPVGIVDQDKSHTSRQLVHKLDAFQTTKVVAHYENIAEARHAIQKNEIYAFLVIPNGTEAGLMAQKQPKISFYYSSVSLAAGSLLFRDLKTISTLGGAAAGMAKLSALGKTNDEIMTFLQPIAVDLHMIGNPYANYNYYLSTVMVPGLIMLFIFLITPYSIGTELKFNRAKDWMRLANNNPYLAIAGKMLPQTLIFLSIFLLFEFYIYHVLDFPHPGGALPIILLGILSVLSCQCFGIFAFGLMPSLRMSMSICSLWGVVSFSICGATYPLFAMDSPIQAIGQLFPMRHYYMIYQMNIFNGFPMSDAVLHWGAMVLFCALPMLTIWNIKKAMLVYKYLP